MRVIAGQYGKRRLKAVPGDNTRPTTDKIKESLFNIIGPYFNEETRVLDFYAGSGALGIEALSRGAGQLYSCERHRAALSVIKENIETLGLEEQTTILGGDNQKALKQLREREPQLQFDLIFLDPPYKNQQSVQQIESFIEADWLSDTVTIVCESDKKDEFPETINGLEKVKDVTYGTIRICIYKWKD